MSLPQTCKQAPYPPAEDEKHFSKVTLCKCSPTYSRLKDYPYVLAKLELEFSVVDLTRKNSLIISVVISSDNLSEANGLLSQLRIASVQEVLTRDDEGYDQHDFTNVEGALKRIIDVPYEARVTTENGTVYTLDISTLRPRPPQPVSNASFTYE